MKKMIFLLMIPIIIFIIFKNYVNAESASEYILQLKVINNKENENIDIYLLLPKEYILYAINNDNLNIDYDGANTLIENYIPSIKVKREQVKTDLYLDKDNNKEYVQILLEKNYENLYLFNILSDYDNMDIKYRINSSTKNNIAHIDNFKIRDNICEIELDYDSDILKQPDVIIIPFATKAIVVLTIIIVFVGLIVYVKER